MKFSFASQRSNEVPPKGDQPGMDRLDSAEERSEEDLPQAKGGLKVASIAWAIAATIAALGPYRCSPAQSRVQGIPRTVSPPFRPARNPFPS